MYLRAFPTQVWELLLPYLKTRHAARLYMTGDVRVQYAIAHTPRATDASALPASDLIMRTLLATTTHATVSPYHLARFASIGSSSTVRTLVITRDTSGAQCPSNHTFDLSDLGMLETFDAHCQVVGRITLPLSVHRLCAVHQAGTEWVTNFGALTNLTHLEVCLTRMHLRCCGGAFRWPPNLTALKIEAKCADNEYKSFNRLLDRVLPSTLLRLTLSNPRNGAFPVIPPAACVALESYELVGRAQCPTEEFEFPRSLKRLALSVLAPSMDLLEALQRSNVTHLSFAALDRWVDGLFSSWYPALCSLLPRMDTDTAEFVARLFVSRFPVLREDRTAHRRMCITALNRAGLGEAYFVLLDHLFSFGPEPSSEDFAALSASHRVRRFASKSEVWRMIELMLHDNSPLFQWAMALGLCGVVCNNQLRWLGGGHLNGDVKDLTMDMHDQLDDESVFASTDLSRIETIFVMTGERDRCVSAIHKHRARFPSLGEVNFRVWTGACTVSNESVSLLAQMRLYPTGLRTNHCAKFVYRTTTPPASTSVQ